MPRDGSNIYHRPPGTDGIPDTTVESAKYNAYVADVEQDLNLPRPIVAGGTGATNARDAMIALSGEIASQIVTNYDADPIVPGSFTSSPGATSAPDPAHYFAGICYGTGNGLCLEAWTIDATSPKKYFRTNAGGTWGPWKAVVGLGSDIDAAFVHKAGDVMTGNLTINAVNAALGLNKTASGQSNTIYGYTNGVPHWVMMLGDGAAESGGNVGSNFSIYNCNDAGVPIAQVFNINRATGAATFSGAATFGGALVTDGAIAANGLSSSANLTAWTGDGTGGTVYFGNGTAHYLTYQSGQFTLNGKLSVVGPLDGNSTFSCPGILTSGGYACRNGTSGGASGTDNFNFFYGAGLMQVWVNATYLGNIQMASDYRIKKDVEPLPSQWETVKALRPIKYTHAEFSPPSHIAYVLEQKVKGADAPIGPLVTDDDIERWGFIAHELQETLTPSAATGVKDSPDTVQSPNPFTLIAALTRALQEAMARIEALEAA